MLNAADAGYLKAQVAVGVAYIMGFEGVEQNYALAEKYLLMGAEKDHTEAQGYLSFLYVNMEDYEKALLWGRKAAQMDNTTACTVLGRIFNEGLGCDVDHIEALKWYEKAADNSDADAQNIVGNMYSDSSLGVLDLKKAFNYYKKAAEQDHVYGMFNLGLCFAEGEGCKKDVRKALNWIEKAANEQCPEAQQWISNYNQTLQEQEKPKEKQTAPKESQPKKKSQEKETKEDIIIDNVRFSTDGRKVLHMEYECEYTRKFDDYEVDYSVYFDNKIEANACGASGCGTQLAKNREKFESQIKDFQLNLKPNTINNKSIVIEARLLDERWDGTQDPKMFPLIASYKTTLKLYYEFHVFGKNVLEIRK